VDLGPPELGILLLAALVLFGYKRLPEASRALGRSLRIFRSEMRGLQDDAPAPTVVHRDS
jgi:sec-independent protein translocase protein TatA